EILEITSAVREDEAFIKSSLNSILTIHQMVQGYSEMYRFMVWLNSAPRSISEAHEELQRTVEKIYENQQSFRDVVTMKEAIDQFKAFLAEKGDIYCSTGIKKLDAVLFGFRPHMLYVIGGRPGMGKTSLGITALREAVNAEQRVLFVTMEMPARDLIARIVSQETGVPLWKLVTNRLTSQEEEIVRTSIEKLEKLRSTKDVIFAENHSSDGDIVRAVRNYEPDIVIIDYLQLCRSSYGGGRIERRDLEIGMITRHLKKLAMEQGIPVILMSQLNRKIEDRFYKLPQLADLRESGNIEQDADVIIFVCRARPEEIDGEEVGFAPQKGSKGKKKLEIYSDLPKDVYPGWIFVAKNRNGPICTIDTWFLGATAQYVDKDEIP
ncbi:MAG: DnaB-like helicase C-terminal domain-containing protein, partial [Thermoproteota archaeon]